MVRSLKDMLFRKCLVVGAGLTGEWAARLLLSRGSQVTVTDIKPKAALAPVMERLRKNPPLPLRGRGGSRSREPGQLRWVLGGHPEKHFLAADLIVMSPGVSWDIPALKKALALGIPVTGEMELASWFNKAPIVAITGSNGKTTTTELLGHIAEKLDRKVFVGGNIGRPLSQLVVADRKVEAAILEVSSYQLETVDHFHAQAAAFLNLSPDHLDRYGDMADYFKAKCRVFNRQTKDDLVVLNGDQPLFAFKRLVGEQFIFSRHLRPENGATVEGGAVVVYRAGRPVAEKSLEAFRLQGAHNQENLMAAVGLAGALGIPPEEALSAAADFSAGRHRLELVGEFHGVRYYNDSKGTNVGATIKALESVSGPVILIAGGQGKGQNFSPLKGLIKEKVKHLILLGEDKENMRRTLKDAAPSLTVVDDLPQAVDLARLSARPGETVLLSPACASFDMFDNYQVRGDRFIEEVRKGGRP